MTMPDLVAERDFSPQVKRWLERQRNRDFHALMLSAGSDADRRNAALQIECRRKVRRKLPEAAANDAFLFPTLLSVEQCTSEALAAYHASLVAPGSSVLDMTSGLGIDVLAIARRATHVTALERTPEVSYSLQYNASVMGLDNIDAVCADSVEWIKRTDRKFDLIFIDPARRDGDGGRIYNLADCEPDVVDLMQRMLEVAPEVIVKASPMFDIARAVKELSPYVVAVRTIGTESECKELLITYRRDSQEPVCREAVTIGKEGVSLFGWNPDADSGITLRICNSVVDNQILYEPWPAVMKSGAFRQLCLQYDVAQLDLDTHLFLSDEFNRDFPGTAYRIAGVYEFNKSSIKELRSKYGHINVAVRNFVMTATDLERRLKIKSGGTCKLFGVRAAGEMRLIVGEPLA